MPINDCIHHYPMALFNDIPRVGAYFYDIPGSPLHIHAVDSNILLLGNNRVLKNRSPPIARRSRYWTGGNDALSHSYDQDTVIYCRTTSIGCSANQATSELTVELHHTWDTCSLATHTRRTCHLRIYGGIRWDRFVSSATSTTGILTDLTTDLIMANNNINKTYVRNT